MKEDMPSRRLVLCQALAVGGGLWVPMVLSGCDSKTDTTSASPEPTPTPTPAPAPADSPAATADSSAPVAAAKVTQASVQYQTQPKGEQKCSACQHFMAESQTCKLVEGQISPEGWCTLWLKKA